MSTHRKFVNDLKPEWHLLFLNVGINAASPRMLLFPLRQSLKYVIPIISGPENGNKGQKLQI